MHIDRILQDFLDDEDPPHIDKENLKKTVNIIIQILEALRQFEHNYHKKLNLTKLAQYLGYDISQIELLVKLITEFQKTIAITFNNYWIKPRVINNNIFLVTEEKDKTLSKKIVYIKKEEQKVISDIIYVYKFIKKGEGLSFQQETSSFMQNIRKLYSDHPYFFRTNGEHLIYPSEIGLKVGEIIHSHYKCNKTVDKIELEQYQFVFE